MTAGKNGGPAFPSKGDDPADAEGMTLRDWFAGQAIIAIGTWCPTENMGDYTTLRDPEGRQRRAEWAYAQADAMLAARAKAAE